jgi:cell division protease FtsH
MDKLPNKPQRQDDKKPTTSSSQVLLYMLLIATSAGFFAFFFNWHNAVVFDYREFEELVKQSSKSPAATEGYIQVNRGTEKNPAIWRYSDIHDVKVGDREITGLVNQEEIDPKTGPPAGKLQLPKIARFRVNKSTEIDIGVSELLRTYNVNFDWLKPGFFQTYGPMLMITAIFVLVLVFISRRLGGAGSPMAFGRSRGKLYAQEGLGVTFADVAGIDEAVEELKEVVDFLSNPEKYQRLGGRIPKGVLLVGPPGTGKTLLAKGVAGEAGVPFFSLSGSDFVEMFVGVGAARVRDMFQQAQNKSPCIIFIDELDALGKTRGASVVGGNDEREQTLNALLVEMDGFESNNGVIVLAATNRPETLDSALLRPGRFDRHVLVDRPDIRGRKSILKVHVKNVKLADGVDLGKVAAITSGFCGADLANLVNEAALLAARAERTSVTMAEFDEGVERVTAGLEKRQRIIHEDEKQRIAYHESGHALVADSLPNTDPVHKISIIPRGLAALGYTMQRPEEDRYLITKSELEARIQVLLAGTVAEELVFEDVSSGAQNDLERATEIARNMVMQFGMSRLGRVNYKESVRSPFMGGGDGLGGPMHSEQTAHEIDLEVKQIIDDALSKVRHILSSRRETLLALSQRLVKCEVMDADELREIVDQTSSSPKIVPGTESADFKTAAPDQEEVPGVDAPAVEDKTKRSGKGTA